MELAYNDKMARNKEKVKNLLIREDLSDRTVDTKEVKTKDSKETAKMFSKMV